MTIASPFAIPEDVDLVDVHEDVDNTIVQASALATQIREIIDHEAMRLPEYVQIKDGKARVLTRNSQNYNIGTGSDAYSISVDGGTAVTGDLTTGGSRTAAQVASDLTDDVAGITASVSDGKVLIETESSGSDSSIEFDDLTGDCNAVLGIEEDEVFRSPQAEYKWRRTQALNALDDMIGHLAVMASYLNNEKGDYIHQSEGHL